MVRLQRLADARHTHLTVAFGAEWPPLADSNDGYTYPL